MVFYTNVFNVSAFIGKQEMKGSSYEIEPKAYVRIHKKI